MDKEAIIQDQINLLLEEQKKAVSLDEKLKIASTIAEQNKSLQTLSVQMKQEKSRSELKQRQKAFWGFAGGVLVGAIAASR